MEPESADGAQSGEKIASVSTIGLPHLSKRLSFLTMDFFADARILFWGRRPDCRAWVDKVFEGYYVLDFAEAGALLHAEGMSDLEEIAGPVAWLTYPGKRFRFGWPALDRAWNHRFVAFAGERARAYADSGLFPLQREPAVFPLEGATGFAEAFDGLLDWLERNGPGPGRRGVHLLEGLLLGLSDRAGKERGEEAGAGRRSLRDAVAAVEADVGREWDFRQVAAEASMSYHHFRRMWRAITGLPPQEFLIDRRLKAVARRLRMESAAVKRIALESGFRDMPYFTRQFRRRFGMPPGRYRQEAAV